MIATWWQHGGNMKIITLQILSAARLINKLINKLITFVK